MYSRGMTTREIRGHLQDMCGVEVSPTLISEVTDPVMEEVKGWQNRALESTDLTSTVERRAGYRGCDRRDDTRLPCNHGREEGEVIKRDSVWISVAWIRGTLVRTRATPRVGTDMRM
jgi:hypothetical protein